MGCSVAGTLATLRVALDHARIADNDGLADRLHGRVERRLQAHFRTDAGRVSGCNGNARPHL